MKQTLQQPHLHTAGNGEIETCDICHHHHLHLPMKAPEDETLYRLADLYKVFGDPTRIRILYALSGGELCVCDIAELLGIHWLMRMWQPFSHRDWIMCRSNRGLLL